MALAASRKEIDAFANTIGGTAGARRPWVESGQMRVLFNFEPDPVPGLGVPTVFEFVEPTNIARSLLSQATLLGRPTGAARRAPDRVNLLRRAFEATISPGAAQGSRRHVVRNHAKRRTDRRTGGWHRIDAARDRQPHRTAVPAD
jgi:hypothetical protein